jgi:hypothetical protein
MLSPLPWSVHADADALLRTRKSSLGDAKSSLGDAKSSLGVAKSSVGDAESSLGDAKRADARRAAPAHMDKASKRAFYRERGCDDGLKWYMRALAR